MAAERPVDMTRKGFGRAPVDWLADPDVDAVPRALSAFIHHHVAAHLRGKGFTAKHLSENVGGSRTGWTNKLNGIRPFSVADVAVLAFGVDPSVWNVFPHDAADATDLLPANYVPLLGRLQLGQGIPQFVTPGVARGAARFAEWWRAEATAGRGWALTMDVARQRAVYELDSCGLPSAEASAGTGDTASRTVDWVARSARLRILWLWPQPGAALTVAQSLTAIGELLWTSPAVRGVGREIVVLGAPAPVVHNLANAFGFTSADPPEAVTISLQAAHQLGLKRVDAELPDQTLTIHSWDPQSPVWMEIKT